MTYPCTYIQNNIREKVPYRYIICSSRESRPMSKLFCTNGDAAYVLCIRLSSRARCEGRHNTARTDGSVLYELHKLYGDLNKHLLFNFVSNFLAKQLLPKLKSKLDGSSRAFRCSELSSDCHNLVSGVLQHTSELRGRVTCGTLTDHTLIRQDNCRRCTNSSIFLSCVHLFFQYFSQSL